MKTLGLIAGNGDFPLLFIKQAKKAGVNITVVALYDETEKSVEQIADKTYWAHVGQLSKIIDLFKREHISQCAMVGQVKHTKLFSVKPDLRAVMLLTRLKNKTADSILSAVCEEFKKEGIEFVPSNSYLSEFIPGKGVITKKSPDKNQIKDIEFGYELAKKISGLDIGQTVCVKSGSIVAVEAMEGTDRCILRAGEITKDFVVVKVARPNQDMRFDIPVVGIRTIETVKRACASVIAVESGKTLFLDMEEVISAADKNKIIITAV